MKRNYDSVAAIYDRFSRLVFGRVQVDAQLYLLPFIPAGCRVLIVGGGTGWILEEIRKIHPSGLAITYVDSSAKMIALAKQRDSGANKVTFITAGVSAIPEGEQFDVALTPFLFDNFTQSEADSVFSAIDGMLAAKGTWLYCDFQNSSVLWHKFLLKLMYLFFGLVCGVRAKQLPDMKMFAGKEYKLAGREMFMSGFIVAEVYRKG